MVENNYSPAISNEAYITASEELGKKEVEFLVNKPKPTFTDKLDAALTDNVVGYTTAKEVLTNQSLEEFYDPFSGFSNEPIESKNTPITIEERSSILSQAKVDVGDLADFDSYNTQEEFYNALGRYSNK